MSGIPGNRQRKGRTWADLTEEARHRKRQHARARRRNHQVTWDGVTDEQILERDRWTCRMDKCIYGSRRINPKRKYPDQRSASIDHILPLSLGGDDTEYNKRAAHLGCNMARGQGKPGEQLPMAFGLDPNVEITLRKRGPAGKPCATCGAIPGSGCKLHMPVYYFTCQACGCLFVSNMRRPRKACDRAECKAAVRLARWDDQVRNSEPHKKGLEAARLRAEGLDWWQIADRLGYSAGQYAAAAAARAVGERSPRRTAPYVRTQRIGQHLIA